MEIVLDLSDPPNLVSSENISFSSRPLCCSHQNFVVLSQILVFFFWLLKTVGKNVYCKVKIVYIFISFILDFSN